MIIWLLLITNPTDMGSSESQEHRIDPNFKMQRYLNQGLNQKQVLMVREIF